MERSTFRAVQSLLTADETLTTRERRAIADAVRRHGKSAESEVPSIISRSKAAELLNRTTRSVDQLASEGILERVKLPGKVRGCGFRKSDVIALIEGKH